MKDRLVKARKAFKDLGVDAFVIMNEANRRWLSGFTGSSAVLVITQEASCLMTDGRYTEQAADQSPDFEVVDVGRPFEKSLAELFARLGVTRAAFESDHLTYRQITAFKEALPETAWEPSEGVVSRLRRVKDASELEKMKKAAAIADEGLKAVLPMVKPGISERDLMAEIEYRMSRLGSEVPSFETIVASGVRSSLPHGHATDKRLQAGDLLTFDWGAVYDGYHSDCTRTYLVAEETPVGREIYQTVLSALEASLNAVRAGVVTGDLDAVARKVIDDSPYEGRFVHSLGHGVGLDIHEGPGLGSGSQDVLEEGMFVTFEPGIYVPGVGGCRIEESGVITKEGVELFTHLPRSLQVL